MSKKIKGIKFEDKKRILFCVYYQIIYLNHLIFLLYNDESNYLLVVDLFNKIQLKKHEKISLMWD